MDVAFDLWFGVGVGFLLAGIGSVRIQGGLRALRERSELADAPRLSDDAPADGYVIVQGPVTGPVEGREPMRSPVTDTPCVAYDYRVEQQRRERHENSGGGFLGASNRWGPWSLVDRGGDAIPFLMDVEGRRVRVDAADARIHWHRHERVSTADSHLEPSRDADSFMAYAKWIARLVMGKRRRYREARLASGNVVHVAGYATPSGDVITVTSRKGRDAPLVISDAPLDGVLKRVRGQARNRVTWGGILVFVGVFLLLDAVGVIGG